MTKNWEPIQCEYGDVEKSNISKLIDGTIPALIVRDFYDKKMCQIAVRRTQRYSNFNMEKHFLKKIGVSLISYVTKKSEYFANAEAARGKIRNIFEGMEDPRKKIHKFLSEVYPQKSVRIAVENEKKYACGVIRIHDVGDFAQIHRDSVKYEAPNFEVSKISHQLSSVLYLQQSETGGELKIYKKIWKKSDERFREIEFGYSKEVLEGCSNYIKIKPNQGDLILINPIYFHEILPVRGKKKRVTLGLFLGFADYRNSILTWS